MASLKFFLLACMLVACVAAQSDKAATPTDPTQGDEQTTDAKRYKKDVLLSTLTYPYAQPAVPLLKTFSPISTIRTITPSYYRTVYPHSYYTYPNYYNYPYEYSPSQVYYLRK